MVNIIMKWILKRTRQEPTILSEEEFQKMSKPMMRKLVFRWFILLFGLAVLVAAVIAFIDEWYFSIFEFTIQYEGEDRKVNASIILPILMTTIGLWIVSRFSMNINMFRENTTYIPHLSKIREPLIHHTETTEEVDFLKFRSFASSRLILAFFSIILAGYNIFFYGFDLTTESLRGNWFVLGGPTLFYPLSVLPLVVAIGLVFYTLFSSAIITISKTPHLYRVEEYRFLAPWMTEIPRDQVRGIKMTNSHTGPKYAWIFVLGIHIIWCYVEGFHFLLNPFTFGYGWAAGWSYIATATVQLIVLLTLILKTQTLLEIITATKRYELQYAPPAIMPNVRGSIESFFGIPALTEHQIMYNRYEQAHFNQLPSFQMKRPLIKDYTNIGTGALFIGVALIGNLLNLYAGDPLRLVLYLFGLTLLIKGWKNDFSSPRNRWQLKYDPKSQSLTLRKEWMWYNTAFRMLECQQDDYHFEFRLNSLNFFEVLIGIVPPLMIGWTMGAYFRFVPVDTLSWWIGLFSVLLSLFLIFMVFVVICNPQNTLMIHTKSIQNEMPFPGTLLESQYEEFQRNGVFGRLFFRWRFVIQHQKSSFFIRLFSVLFFTTMGVGVGIYLF